ncbi:MAG: hypothetical protein C4K58_06980 [Flavobacteriaceae bacterium]|nr:MAG: hypothetical protein C4K58_06980 [Flavobacteriaceae bacterium]
MAYITSRQVDLSDGSVSAFVVSPPEHKAGNLIMLFITTDVGTGTISVDGFTLVGTQSEAQGQRTVCFYKIATSDAEPDVNITSTVAVPFIASTVVISGASTTNPINGFSRVDSANSTAAFLDSGTVTTTVANCLVLQCFGFDNTFKLIPQNQDTFNFISKEINSACQIVGFFNQYNTGTTPINRALSEVASEGGTSLTIAIADANPTNPLLEPMANQPVETLARYGNATSPTASTAAFIRHDNITIQPLSQIAATTINGLAVLSATVTEGNYNPVPDTAKWGSASVLNVASSGIDATGRWLGATHTFPTKDFTNKLFSLEWGPVETSTVRLGVQGHAVYFQDASNNWACFQLSIRQSLLANSYQHSVIDVSRVTPLATSGNVNWNSINRIAYLFHKIGSLTNAVGIRLKNACLLKEVVFVGGNEGKPINPTLADEKMVLNGSFGIASVQGSGQALIKTGIQLGNGVTKTVVKLTATSHEQPLRFKTSNPRRFYNVLANNPNSAYSINASPNDIIDATACIIATDVTQDFIIKNTSSPLASYDFSGSSIIGYDIKNLASGVIINGATLQNCTINLVGGGLHDCNVVGSRTHLVTDNLSNVKGNTFESPGSGFAIEITQVGTYTFEGNTFAGFGANGTTDAVILNSSGGLVTINVPNPESVVTVLNDGTSTTVFLVPTSIIINGAEPTDIVEMVRYSDHQLLDTFTGSGEKDITSSVGEVVYFRRIMNGQVIASSYANPTTIVAGENGEVGLFTGKEVMIAEEKTIEQTYTQVQKVLNNQNKLRGGILDNDFAGKCEELEF